MMSFVDKPRFSNIQTAAGVFILSYKHIGIGKPTLVHFHSL